MMDSFEQTRELYKQGFTIDEVKQHLENIGLDQESVEEQLIFARKLKMQKQMKQGFTLMLLGAIICISSCIVTFFHSYSASYMAFSLYGMTFIGASLVLIGLIYVFGF